ncbi:hypothetical protein CK203_106330 [Vitis vinifera]|uniref:Reverse transcriptase domain-containing protein n=1 Tax=Vitis vinifera TaxID=29760 RepID=A0A438CDS4_VITVI|nr:hypothetical protein CK203_106330 [Vitis vinifera]
MFKEFYEQSAFIKSMNISDESHEKDGVWFKVAGMDMELYIHSQIFGVGEWSVDRIQGGGRQPVHVSHLLFADDTIVFCEARKEYLVYLSWILFWFEAASGLRINLEKSELIPVGEVEEMEENGSGTGLQSGLYALCVFGAAIGGP